MQVGRLQIPGDDLLGLDGDLAALLLREVTEHPGDDRGHPERTDGGLCAASVGGRLGRISGVAGGASGERGAEQERGAGSPRTAQGMEKRHEGILRDAGRLRAGTTPQRGLGLREQPP